MTEQPEEVTVYRSADSSAEDDAREVCAVLEEAGLHPELLDDNALGVPSGAWEVRVPAAESGQAEALVNSISEMDGQAADASHDFDLEVIFEGVGSTAEVEALGVRAVLDANGIPSVVVGVTAYPNLPFAVKVPHNSLDAARLALDEARQGGAEAADDEHAAGEDALTQ